MAPTSGRHGKITAKAASTITRLRLKQHLADVLAILNEMMGRRGFVKAENPSDPWLDHAI
jgi:hypothetical protein